MGMPGKISLEHSGKVSAALANANSRWVSDKEVDNNVYKDFERLKYTPFNLLYDLLHHAKRGCGL